MCYITLSELKKLWTLNYRNSVRRIRQVSKKKVQNCTILTFRHKIVANLPSSEDSFSFKVKVLFPIERDAVRAIFSIDPFNKEMILK